VLGKYRLLEIDTNTISMSIF